MPALNVNGKGGVQDGVNGVKLTLPDGFSFTPAAPVISVPASVTIAGNEITFDKFQVNSPGVSPSQSA